MKRVEVTRQFVNVCTMQVCAEADATDEEILAVCNERNASGTSNGWSEVVRAVEEGSIFKGDSNKLPVVCAAYPGRTHFLVLC